MTNPRHAALILCLLATPAGAQSVPTPPDDLQKAADICARHELIRACPELESRYCIELRPDWVHIGTGVTRELRARNEAKQHEAEAAAEAARREAEKLDREFVEKVAKGLKP